MSEDQQSEHVFAKALKEAEANASVAMSTGAFQTYEVLWSTGVKRTLILTGEEGKLLSQAVNEGLSCVWFNGAGLISVANLKCIFDIDGQAKRAEAIRTMEKKRIEARAETGEAEAAALLKEVTGKDMYSS